MKLEGSLDAFGLPDVCALLASTGKSGVLELTRTKAADRVHGQVWFKVGDICGATADTSRQSLARRLIGSGVVDDLALRHAVARTVSGGTGVARALLEAGATDAQVVKDAAREQLTDALSELLTWTDGEFAFNGDAQFTDDVGLAVSVPQALKDATDRHDLHASLTGIVSSVDAVLTMTPGVVSNPSLTREEWTVLALIDGKRSVQDLSELTGSGIVGVMSVLSGLLARGLVRVKDPTTSDHVSTIERRLAMLGSIESGAEPVQPTVVQVASPPVPGGLGATAAAALTFDPPPGPGFARNRSIDESYRVPADLDHHVVESGPTTQGGLGASMSVATPMPGGLGAQVVAAHTGSMGHGFDSAAVQTATAPVNYAAELIRRDPMMNRTLLLRLIAGVRGL